MFQNLLFDFPLQADQQHCTVSTTLEALTRSPRGTDSTLFAVSVARGHQAQRGRPMPPMATAVRVPPHRLGMPSAPLFPLGKGAPQGRGHGKGRHDRPMPCCGLMPTLCTTRRLAAT